MRLGLLSAGKLNEQRRKRPLIKSALSAALGESSVDLFVGAEGARLQQVRVGLGAFLAVGETGFDGVEVDLGNGQTPCDFN